MNLYELTQRETWALSAILNLPIQHGSVLGEWLAGDDTPDVDLIQTWMPECLKALKEKGYFDPDGQAAGDLVTILMLAAVGQKHLFASLRTAENAVATRFLLAGTGVIQYGVEPEKITLHSPQQIEQLLPYLLPEWLKIEAGESFTLSMPLNAFLVFKQSCQQQNIAYVLNADQDGSFSLTELSDSFQQENGWLDVYHALGLKGFEPLQEVSIPEQLDHLVKSGMIDQIGPKRFRIGPAGSALAEAFSDSRLVTISLSFSSVKPSSMTMCAFLIGNGHLFRMDFLDEMVTFTVMQSRQEGLDWISKQL